MNYRLMTNDKGGFGGLSRLQSGLCRADLYHSLTDEHFTLRYAVAMWLESSRHGWRMGCNFWHQNAGSKSLESSRAAYSVGLGLLQCHVSQCDISRKHDSQKEKSGPLEMRRSCMIRSTSKDMIKPFAACLCRIALSCPFKSHRADRVFGNRLRPI